VIRGVTFDLDGTLADTLPVCYAAFRAVFRQHIGREYSDDEIHALFGPCEKGVIRNVIAHWQPAFDMFLREYEKSHDLCLTPFQGIQELLDWLRNRSVRIAVVTGKGAESAAISLRRLGLDGLFERVEAGSPEGAIKIDGIRRIKHEWGFGSEEMVHVGDAPSDICAAREVGTLALGAAWATTTKRELLLASKPDAVLDSVGELRRWLAQRV
jgi:pyrophosphatase PpaX